MLRILILLLALLPSVSTAQITVDTLWMHRATTDEEDIDSYFPILKHKTNPAISNLMNTALQMQALGFILNAKNKASFMTVDANPRGRTNYSFNLVRVTDRLIGVDFSIYQFRNAMSNNGWNQTRRFYFDAATGHPVTLYEIFSSTPAQSQNLEQQFKESFLETMQRYNGDFTEKSIPAMEQECECHCMDHIHNAWCNDDVSLEYDEHKQMLRFSMYDCDWMNPRYPDRYLASVDYATAIPWLTPYGKYLLHGDAPIDDNTSIFKMWKGTIGGTIPITFIIKPQGCNPQSGTGLEIYDKFGTSIPLTYDTRNFPNVKFAEIGNNGIAVATIEAKLVDGKLTGTWIKADKSKALPFEARVAR